MDQLTTEELHLIVNHIDRKQKTEGREEQAKQESKQQDQEAPKQGDEGEAKPAGETKEERKKRLHARNMRYYRSLESCLPFLVYVGFSTSCPL